MTIDDKYLNLLGKFVYNKIIDKFGHISSIELSDGIGGYYIGFNVYYDTFDDRHILFLDDFKKKKIQFVIFKDKWFEEYKEQTIEAIKKSFGEEFSENMLLYITEDEKKAKDSEHNQRNIQTLHLDLISLSDISAEVMSRDFYSRELYLKYKEKILTKEELLYALVNHLSQELERANERNKEYFFKYEFLSTIEEFNASGEKFKV